MWVLTALSVALLLWLLLQLREMVVLLVVGYVIAYLINPLVSWLERRGLGRALAIPLVFVGALALLFVLVLTALPTLSREIGSLVERFPEYLETARARSLALWSEIRAHLPPSMRWKTDPLASLPAFPGQTVRGVVGALLNTLLGGYSIILIFVNLALLPFIVFYLSVDFQGLHRNVLAMFPTGLRGKIRQIALEIDLHISAFIRGQLLVGAILTGVYTVGLGIVGVELWFLLALLSGFGNLVPYLGFLTGISLSTLMTLVTFGDLTHLLWVWGIYGAAQILEGTLLTPRIVGERVGLSPLVVILAIFAGGKLFGLLGIFLAVPMAAVFKVLGRALHQWLLSRAQLMPE